MTCKPVVYAAAVCITFGCALTPSGRYSATADSLGLDAFVVRGAGFEHQAFRNTAIGRSLHVYFEGDGSPWIAATTVARDPTPRRAYALALMARDPAPAVLLGRPCYHGRAAGCEPQLWTSARYSEAVVASMAAATERLVREAGSPPTTLVGYSGGGALALLVANRLNVVERVVTVAANLDTDAWTRLHGYLPLTGSYNPAELAVYRDDLEHVHYAGGADTNVPPAVHRRLAERLPAASFRTVPGFTHRCCWLERWPVLLAGDQAP